MENPFSVFNGIIQFEFSDYFLAMQFNLIYKYKSAASEDYWI